MRSRTRRAASARRRPRSTSPPVSRRRASGRSSSTSTRRRTRRPGSACARTARRATTCSTARRSSELTKHTAFPNLDLVPSKPELAGAVVELAQREDGERYLKQALASGTSQYDFVFLDCPPSLGPLTVNALAAADRVLVPVQAEYYALEGLSQLMQSIDLIRRRLNPSLGIGGVLLTMVDARTRLAADVEAEVRKHFGAARLPAVGSALGAARRGAEPRAARDCLRPPLGRRRRVLEGGDGACRARLTAAASAAASKCSSAVSKPAPSSCSSCRSTRSTRTRSSRGSASTARRARVSPSRCAARA